jgi:SAM-dependent methyltransferase
VTSGPVSLVRRIARHGLLAALRARALSAQWADRAAVKAGTKALRGAAGLILFPHRHESPDIPRPFTVASVTFDVLGDLMAYTGLPRKEVECLLRRRSDSFRLEWHSLPPKLRVDSWYYLSTRSYLFANAIHVHSEPQLPAAIAALSNPPARVLDFGGGTGNLALALAADGFAVDYLELSALQKDFVRFRAARYQLAGDLRILDWWQPLESRSYAIVCALDVFEHVPDIQATLDRVLPAVAPGGLLVESSPFTINVSNPMHHEDIGFDRLVEAAGFELESATDQFRVWRSSTGRMAPVSGSG